MTRERLSCGICRCIDEGQVEVGWPSCVALPAPDPVAPGCLIIAPRRHLTHLAEDSGATGLAVQCAAQLAADRGGSYDLAIFSRPEQTHLAVYLVPRQTADGLNLRWMVGEVPGLARFRSGNGLPIELHLDPQSQPPTRVLVIPAPGGGPLGVSSGR